uniref:F-box domain-containing protein n=1 Tax=Caenorhabditis tropicalis TaxID=1561998 RepID=A0A1I7T601_9PELO
MNSRPLNYDSLKVVLEYLEPNIRFQLSIRCPSIRQTEKLVPLKLDFLQFQKYFIRINQTGYLLRVEKESSDGAILSEEDRLLCHDLDEYGVSEQCIPDVITPGDIDLGRIPWGPSDETELYYEWNLRIFEKALEIRNQENSEPFIGPYKRESWIEMLEWPEGLNEEQEEALKREYIETLVHYPSKNLLVTIEGFREFLEPYFRRRDKIPPPFTMKLELSVDHPKGEHRIRYPYTIKLQEAAKRLNTFFFGDRPMIHTNCFCVRQTDFVIPLPVGFKIKSRRWDISAHNTLFFESLKTIFDDASFPLEVIHLNGVQIEEEFEHEIIRNTKFLIIRPCFPIQYILNLLLLLNTRNTRIRVLTFWDDQALVEQQLDEIQFFIDNPIKIGTSVSFGIKTMESINRFAGIVNERILVLPLDENRRLEFECRKSLYPSTHRKFDLTMTVVAIETNE